MTRTISSIVTIPVRALVVALGYAAALVVAGTMAGLLIPSQASASGPDTLVWILIGVFVAALFLGPLAARIPASRSRQILVWLTLLFLNLTAVMLEGAFFAPQLITFPLPALLAAFIASAVEIFFQNMSTGIVAGLLLGSPLAPAGSLPAAQNIGREVSRSTE